jgi:hypothetical protein
VLALAPDETDPTNAAVLAV